MDRFALCVLASSWLSGCAADGGETFDDDFETEPGVFILAPETLSSGFDGTHVFRVPLAADSNAGDITWESSDDGVASFVSVTPPPELQLPADAPFVESWIMLTTKKAGTVKITARAGTFSSEVTLVVAAYDPATYAVGDTRYNTPANPGASRVACASCHQQANGVDHSPTWMSGATDAQILEFARTGKVTLPQPDGTTYVYEAEGVAHAFDLTDDEASGIIAYLRALPPRGFP